MKLILYFVSIFNTYNFFQKIKRVLISYFSCCNTIEKSCNEIAIARFFFLQNSVNMCSIWVDRARKVLIRFYFFQTNIVPIRFHCNAFILPMDERKWLFERPPYLQKGIRCNCVTENTQNWRINHNKRASAFCRVPWLKGRITK